MAKQPRFRRILLKLSGEALMGSMPFGFEFDVVRVIAEQVRDVHGLGVQVAMVIGGGNIYRGLAGATSGIDRVTGDHMGMLATVINSLAMHVAACEPRAVDRDEVTESVLNEEREIYRQQAAATGKPAAVIEKIVTGRMEKFYQEFCLLEQPFVRDPNLTVRDVINAVIAKTGENIRVRRFARFVLGQDGAPKGTAHTAR